MTKKVTKVIVYFDDGTYQEVGGTWTFPVFPDTGGIQPVKTDKQTFPYEVTPWRPHSTPLEPFKNKEYVLD